MTLGSPGAPVERPERPDDTTRYLCAAVHLDPAYGNRALKEFLAEPTRPVPPSPGLDAGRVLAEAVRARIRSKSFDAVLLLIAILFLILTWGTVLLVLWVVVAVVLALPGWLNKAGMTDNTKVSPKAIIGAFVVVAAAYFLATYGDELFDTDEYRYARSEDFGASSGGETAKTVIAVFLALAALGVLAAQRWSTWQLLTTQFSRGARDFHRQDDSATTSPLVEDFTAQLARYRSQNTTDPAPPGYAPLIVHRGYNPFVGSGLHRPSWSMAIPLESLPDDEVDEREPLTTASMYAGIRHAVEVLRTGDALSPDGRLGQLKVFDAVFVPAAELVDHFNSPDSTPYLPDPESAPNSYLTAQDVERVRLQPKEWARYYLCFQVETWDRQLVMTTYLHVAVNETTLYLEWTPCVLPPVRARYQAVDKMHTTSAKPFLQALLDWLKLPATTPLRAFNVFSWIRSPRREAGVLDPDRYGSLKSLRELAADNHLDNYFQLVDIERYDKIIESRLLPAISKKLRAAGYSEAKFEQQAAVVINNDVTINGSQNTVVQSGQNRGSIKVASTPPQPMTGK